METVSRILAVDDDTAWLDRLTSILERDGYIVDQASTLHKAKEKIQNTVYAIILIDLDLDMGKEQSYGGFELLKEFESIITKTKKQQGKAIVVSAHGDVERIRQAFKLGAYDFIRKQSFEPNDFLSVIREAFMEWKKSLDRELTNAEKKEYERVRRDFIKGKSIKFDIPQNSVNPWENEQ